MRHNAQILITDNIIFQTDIFGKKVQTHKRLRVRRQKPTRLIERQNAYTFFTHKLTNAYAFFCIQNVYEYYAQTPTNKMIKIWIF